MPTNTEWTRPLLIALAVVLFLGILWLGSMVLMHLMMMGPDEMAAVMGFFLVVLILLEVVVLLSWQRGAS